jgi:hypothetical protein
MGMDGTAIAAAGKRVLALGLLLGALIVVALLLGTGSAQAREKGLGDTLGVQLDGGHHHSGHQRSGHHAASAGHHADKKAKAGRTASAHHSSATNHHAVRNTLRQVSGAQPVRRTLTPVTKSLSQAVTRSSTPRSEPAERTAATPVRDTVKAAVNTVRSTQPVKHVQDATLLLAKTVGDVRRTAQHLTGQVLPTLPPPGLPGVPVPPAAGPDSDHPAAGTPQARGAFDSAAATAYSGAAAHASAQAAAPSTVAAGAQNDTASPGLIARIGTAVSALRDLPSLPTPGLPGPPHQDSGASSSVALFAGMLGAALLLALMSGLARLRSRRFRLVPNPSYRPSSPPD